MTEEFRKLFESLPGTGWLKLDEALLLWESARQTEGPILEVGCYHGRSTCLLASLGRLMYCVDPFEGFDSNDPGGEQVFQHWADNLKERGITFKVCQPSGLVVLMRTQVILYKRKIEDWVPKSVGFAYLDGDHTRQGTVNQINKALKCGARVLCLHDYDERGGGREIKAAVEESGLVVVGRAGSMVECLPLKTT